MSERQAEEWFAALQALLRQLTSLLAQIPNRDDPEASSPGDLQEEEEQPGQRSRPVAALRALLPGASISSLRVQLANRDEPEAFLLDSPQEEEEQSHGVLLVGQGRVCPQAPSFQPRSATPLHYPLQAQSDMASVLADFPRPSQDKQVAQVASWGSSSTELCWEDEISSLEVSRFVNNSRTNRIYYDIWSSSSNGDTPDIRVVIHQYDTDIIDKVIAIDAVCTHVPIILGQVPLEDVVRWLHRGLDLCDGIRHSIAKVLIVRLKRRIACIYFRQGMLEKARKEIDEVQGLIHYMLKDCVDVGIADGYWLLAWIRLYEVWHNESQLAAALPDILYNARMALKVADQLPTEELRAAYCGRIACNSACLKLLIASHSHFQDRRDALVEEADEHISKTAHSMLAKRDRSLWCRVKVWLHLIKGEPSEVPKDLSIIIRDCCGFDSSNNVFTEFSVYRDSIERKFK